MIIKRRTEEIIETRPWNVMLFVAMCNGKRSQPISFKQVNYTADSKLISLRQAS